MDIKNIVLDTERLTLRRFKTTDLEDFFEYASVEGVGEMAGWKHHKTIETTKLILQMFIEDGTFAIEYKQNSKVIGSISLKKSWADDDSRYEHLKSKELGYVLSKEYWGKGLMHEAVKEIILFSFEQLNLEVLTCNHFSTNLQSKRVIQKSGFQFEKKGTYFSSQLNKSFSNEQYILFPK